MTPLEAHQFAQLCRRLHPRGPDEAALIEQGVAWLELLAAKGNYRHDKGVNE